MDMLKYKDIIEEGDMVIVFLDIRHSYPLTIKSNDVFQSKFGALKHNDCIGKKFGSAISCTKGYVYVLFPTTDLWTRTLPHRTQILYTADISYIVLQLDLKPGSIVFEAGTGSGSLTHALARTVAPNGKVYTFDFHEIRVDIAEKEFDSHGLSSLVTIQKRDVCTNGFGYDHIADAVFLDLPNPWEAIPHTVKVLKLSGGRICTFSPCIEQVQHTCLALRNAGFQEITTAECLQRTYDVKKITQTILDFNAPTLKENENKEPVEEKVIKSDNESSSKITSSRKEPSNCETVTHWSAVPPLETPGHTGYLIHATYWPLENDSAVASQSMQE